MGAVLAAALVPIRYATLVNRVSSAEAASGAAAARVKTSTQLSGSLNSLYVAALRDYAGDAAALHGQALIFFKPCLLAKDASLCLLDSRMACLPLSGQAFLPSRTYVQQSHAGVYP